MAVNFQDYYATLHVERDASPDAIKRAYRKLARQHHPDKAAPEDREAAESKIKKINEAYAVLKDPEKRKRYDRLGQQWDQPGFQGTSRATPGGGFSTQFGGTGFSDFFEQFFASGAGGAGFSGMEFGPQFGRSGPSGPLPVEADIMVPLEEALHGATRRVSLRSVDPATGMENTHTFNVRIPVGVRDGQRLRLPPRRGTGEIFLHVRLAPHPDFRVQDGDLHYTLDLAPWEAVLGIKAEIPLHDSPVRLTIPPGTPGGRQFRVRGRGLPPTKSRPAGDLYVAVAIQLPEMITPAERALWEELAQVSPFRPRD